MKKVSVIMATYNCEDTIKEAIESIINQTYSNWELVICDDCSTDNTYNLLLEYKEKYPEKIVLIRNEKNSKLPCSLNRCLEKVTGEYIARMDGDDISTPERLEKQVEFLNNNPQYAVCGTDMVRFDETGEYGYYHSVTNPNKYTLLKEVPFCHATIMMRLEVYKDLNGYTVSDRTSRGQDVDLWFRFYSKGYEGNNIHIPLYKVREDKNYIRRGNIKNAWHVTQTRSIGFKLLDYPISKYYLIPLPIISYMVPRKLKLLRRKLMEN
mgnify:CR=1 FL=1